MSGSPKCQPRATQDNSFQNDNALQKFILVNGQENMSIVDESHVINFLLTDCSVSVACDHDT